MSERPSFTDMMIELRSWPTAWSYPVRELAGRIILADARLSWWYSAVGKVPGASPEDGLELLDKFLEQHENLEHRFSSCKRGEITMDEFTVTMRRVAGQLESLVASLPQPPWLQNAVCEGMPES
ncbi:hypothetical protein [Streptomyces sp. CBMA152]|uniref:hypothetical protein n=1 Tax=Streptomyces sp. CBMA152 TaxID=1896312 RepID=UPI00166110BF|nr:hypothetical protein [Streptomyces sp. CBMA152]MBD0742417.1 hypothetical protein [Streptomyces sp. CBMA152]